MLEISLRILLEIPFRNFTWTFESGWDERCLWTPYFSGQKRTHSLGLLPSFASPADSSSWCWGPGAVSWGWRQTGGGLTATADGGGCDACVGVKQEVPFCCCFFFLLLPFPFYFLCFFSSILLHFRENIHQTEWQTWFIIHVNNDSFVGLGSQGSETALFSS